MNLINWPVSIDWWRDVTDRFKSKQTEKNTKSGWQVIIQQTDREDTQGNRCPFPSQCQHLRHTLFLPSYRRWWTRPLCCLCWLPPPRQTLSLQTWQTTGSYCKAKKGTESTLSEQALVSCSTIPFSKCQWSVRTGYLRSDWSSPLPVTFVYTVHLQHLLSELTRQLLSDRIASLGNIWCLCPLHEFSKHIHDMTHACH